MAVSYTQKMVNRSAPHPGVFSQKNQRPRNRVWVLVMDDDTSTRHVLCRMLERNGYRTYGTSNGDEAVSSYMKAKDCGYAFHAVILDLHVLHGKNGKEAMRELLALDPDVRAIIASGDITDPVAENFGAFGFKGMLLKPFTLKQLDETVRTALDD
jgi:two-component system cell cycle sensor histidine kinase/response regulator CckA